MRCSLKALTESHRTAHNTASYVGTALRRTSFARLQYLRKNGYEDDIRENVMVFVVDAHELAVPDQDAKDLLAKAASAATTEIEAKKVLSAALLCLPLCAIMMPPQGERMPSNGKEVWRHTDTLVQIGLPAPEGSTDAEPWLLRLQALDAAEEEEKSAEASLELLGREDVPAPPDMGDNLTLAPAEMTVAALQEALSKRGLDTKWNPLSANKKKELVDRLQVGL